MRTLIFAAAFTCAAATAVADPLDGKSYIIELSSSQFASGYGNDLVPPLVSVLADANLRSVTGPEADIVVNIVTDFDVGQWMGQGADRVWTYTVQITVGISPGAYVIPDDGTPAFGVRARLLTPDRDREDELACLIKLAARTAIANYAPTGLFQTDGEACLRKHP
jgi:hypothetical protein